MAATAGGVAVGSVIGAGVSQAMFGGGGGHSAPAGQTQAAPMGETYNQTQQPCEGEMGQFVQCALNSSYVEDCVGYLDMLKKCRENVLNQSV